MVRNRFRPSTVCQGRVVEHPVFAHFHATESPPLASESGGFARERGAQQKPGGSMSQGAGGVGGVRGFPWKLLGLLFYAWTKLAKPDSHDPMFRTWGRTVRCKERSCANVDSR